MRQERIAADQAAIRWPADEGMAEPKNLMVGADRRLSWSESKKKLRQGDTGASSKDDPRLGVGSSYGRLNGFASGRIDPGRPLGTHIDARFAS